MLAAPVLLLMFATAVVFLPSSDSPRSSAPEAGYRSAMPAGYDAQDSGADPDSVARLLASARRLQAEKNYPAAIRAAATARLLMPAIEDWSLIIEADARAAAGDTAGARGVAAKAGDLQYSWGWRIIPTAYLAAGDTAGAAEQFRMAAGYADTAERQASAHLEAGRLLLLLGHGAQARAALRKAIEGAPGTRAGLDAALLLATLAPTAEERTMIARSEIANGRAREGATRLESVASAGGAQAAALLVEAAAARFATRDNAGATRALQQSLARSPTGEALAQANLLLGRLEIREGRSDRAPAFLERAARVEGGGASAAHAAFLRADLYHDAGELQQALAFYRRAMQIAPTSDLGRLAAGRAVGIALVRGDAALAAQIARAHRAAVSGREAVQQAAFWLGRAELAAGRRTEAMEAFQEAIATDPAGYYALRSATLSGKPADLTTLHPGPAASDRTVRLVRTALTRRDVLRSAGLNVAADIEFAKARQSLSIEDGSLYGLAEAIFARGEIFNSISIGRQIQRHLDGQPNVRLLRIIFPFPYQEEILAAASRARVDPYLAAGLIRQESMFNSNAVSSAGAIGLMQVMPATAAAVARTEGVAHSEARLREPAHNLRLGARYLRTMLDRYDGHVVKVLAAYNAGPTRVAQWSRFPESADIDLMVERIPFDETRNYVRIVQQNAAVYRALYGSRR
jgi:soluble lytic murein transglycosylase